MSRLFVPGGQSTSIEWWNRLLKTQLSCHLGENTLWSWSNLLWACNIYVGWSANMGFPGGSVVKNPLAMQETQVRSLGQEDPWEKGMTICSSILSRRIPWAEEPGELQSIGSQRVGHN